MKHSAEGQSACVLPRVVLRFHIGDVAARATCAPAQKWPLSYRAGLGRAELARR